MINISIQKQSNKVIVEVNTSIRKVWQRRQGVPRQTFDTESAKNYLTAHGLTGYVVIEESPIVGNTSDYAQSGKWIFEKAKAKAKSPKKTTSRTRK